MKCIIAADISNLYYSIKNKFKGKLSYRKLINQIKGAYEDMTLRAYGSEMKGKGTQFYKALKELGFVVIQKSVKSYGKTDKSNSDVELVISLIELIDLPEGPYHSLLYDIVLLSGDGDMVPFVKYLQKKGYRVHVYGCNINSDLRTLANSANEIGESLLE